MDRQETVRRKFELLAPTMTERPRRFWAGAEADAVGRGGVALVARATGLAISTVRKGRDELRAGASMKGVVRERRPGAGRKALESLDPELVPKLQSMVAPTTRGDPESPLCWTAKSTRSLSRELTKAGHPVGHQKVAELLRAAGYSLQGTSRVKEGASHPDRNAQFEHINAQAARFLSQGMPVVSVDAKKKELVGEYANRGQEWQPEGQAVEVLTYDFPEPDAKKAIPYGVYDIGNNTAYVNVGTNHNTPTFAARSLERWWVLMGSLRYPKATELFVTADAGGSNSYRSLVWKVALQGVADRHGLIIHVSHFPPGTSKWNKIEHRLFSFISMNWRGQPLVSYNTVVSLISATTTSKGLKVEAKLDDDDYPLGVTARGAHGVALVRCSFHGEWNYALHPRKPDQIAAAIERPKVSGRARWKPLIAEQRASGLSCAEFCRRRGISYSTFIEVRRLLVGPIRPSSKPRKALGRWGPLLAAHRVSGGTLLQFCRERGINYSALAKARVRLLGPIRRRKSEDD